MIKSMLVHIVGISSHPIGFNSRTKTKVSQNEGYMQLTIFYDGYCPLCQIEMRKLKSLDKDQKLVFEDIQAPTFPNRYPQLDWSALNARIHVQLDNGSVVSGLDATHLAWKTVGRGWVYAPLRWPVIRWFADHLYLIFARNRYRISFLLTGKKRCNQCSPSEL